MKQHKFNPGDKVTEAGNVYQIQTVFGGNYIYKVLSHSESRFLDTVHTCGFEHVDDVCTLLGATSPQAPQFDTTDATRPQGPILTMQDAFKFDLETKRPRYTGQSKVWHSEGRCPTCGELGRFSMSTAVCSKHGVY